MASTPTVRSASRRFGYQGVAVLVFALLALTIIKPVEIGLVIVATVLLVISPLTGSWGRERPRRVLVAGTIAVAVCVVAGLAVRAGFRINVLMLPLYGSTVLLIPAACGVVFVAWRGKVNERGVRLGIALVLALIVFSVGLFWIHALPEPTIDVLDVHISAAEVVRNGGNPYTDARADNTSPTAATGDAFVGYPYPPLTLLAYVTSGILLGDPRWASVIAMMAVVILITRPWVTMGRDQAGALAMLGLAVAIQPVLGTVFRAGWTDPIALPLLLGAGLLWRKNPVLSAVLLGLALGTKQYYVMALPLLLVWGDSLRWKRLTVAGGVAFLSIMPGLLFGPANFWNATIAPSVGADIRLDSIGLAGVGWETPFWLVIALSVGVAVWMGYRGGSGSRFMLGLGATLAAAFLVGSQAFLNYWFLIGALALLAAAVSVSTQTVAPEDDHDTAPKESRQPDPEPAPAD